MIDVESMITICNMYLEKLKIKLDVESFNECLRHYHSLFLGETKQQRLVLDAKPGHGKKQPCIVLQILLLITQMSLYY